MGDGALLVVRDGLKSTLRLSVMILDMTLVVSCSIMHDKINNRT